MFTSRLVNTVEKYWEHIVQFFSDIHEYKDDDWKQMTGVLHMATYSFWKTFKVIIFSSLFAQTGVIYNTLQG